MCELVYKVCSKGTNGFRLFVCFLHFCLSASFIAVNRSVANGKPRTTQLECGTWLECVCRCWCGGCVSDVDAQGSGLCHQPIYLFSPPNYISDPDCPSLLLSSTCTDSYFPSSIRQRSDYSCCQVLLTYTCWNLGIRNVERLPQWECEAVYFNTGSWLNLPSVYKEIIGYIRGQSELLRGGKVCSRLGVKWWVMARTSEERRSCEHLTLAEEKADVGFIQTMT